VRLWDAATGQELLTLKGHTGPVDGLAFSPDGQRLATAGADVRVWEAWPVPAETWHRRGLVSDVHSLFDKLALREEVVAALQKDPALSAMDRDFALQVAQTHPEDPAGLKNAAWVIVHSGSAGKDAYALALRQAQAALRLAPGDGFILNTLGFAQYRLGQYDQARATLAKSKKLTAENASIHTQLGWVLYEMGQFQDAVEEYRRALTLHPKYAVAHNDLGLCLYHMGRHEEAVTGYRKAIELDSQFAAPHENLGDALADEARFEGAMAEYQKALERGGKVAAERLRRLPLSRRLPAVLRGEDKPANATEQLEFASVCQEYYLRRYVAAERFFAAAFAADARLAEDVNNWNRYDAACAAALAGCGRGVDAAELDETDRARLRGQALAWLRADLAVHRKQLASERAKERAEARDRLQHWTQDIDLVGVREAAGLAKLPEAERTAWEKLWQEVDALIKSADK
jgi:Flp pilus assembly protein TadD